MDAILEFSWDRGIFTATEAMADTGLTRSTAIEAIGELLALGLLRELPNARAAGEYVKGRPARRFELRAAAGVVVGIDAGRARLTTRVADLRGAELSRTVVELTPSQKSREGRRSAVLAAVDSAVHATGRGRECVLAVCVGVPSPVNADGVSPPQKEGFWELMNPGLCELLASRAPIVRVENDASLAAVAEGSVGMAVGLRDFVVVLAGDRLGAGVVIDGHLLRGNSGGVGELRALDHVRGVDSADGVGLRFSQWAAEELAAGVVPPETMARLSEDSLTGRTVLRLAGSGDVWAQRLVGRAGAVLARLTSLFSSLYDPVRVVVAGAVADDLHLVLAAARAQLSRDDGLSAPELVASRLGADAVVTGAVSGAREVALRGVLHLSPSQWKGLQDPGAAASPGG